MPAALPMRAQGAPDDVLQVGTVNVDPPTIVTLGVQLLITGDDNFNASVTMRYRIDGTTTWYDAQPLFRVHPEDSPVPIPTQFAGSIFNLVPATTYDIELHATDPDGPVDQTIDFTATTRGIPAESPQHPNAVSIGDPSALQSALDDAQSGDVITLADGTYGGQFTIHASGTAADPIVIRGASENGVVLDAGGCSTCNVLEIYGSFVHVEQLTLQNANRGLRFEGVGTTDDVVRHTTIQNVTLGIGSNDDQADFYLCDNTLVGRLHWPLVYGSDGGKHSDDDGMRLSGNGHVVCHNAITGFGDAMKYGEDGARADDFYGNDVDGSYDNAIEFDGSDGNVRAFRNRFTNTWDPISFQPVYGGPDYAFDNVVVNAADEQLKFHSNGNGDPNGVLVYHNTFVSPTETLNMQTADPSYHFVIKNNLFVGPAEPSGHVVDWSAPILDGTFDSDGYFPDGFYDFNAIGKYPSFADMQAGGVLEPHGTLLNATTFANGLTPPASYTTLVAPPDATLASTSNAVDAGTPLANIDDGFTGSAPDLGALERGCPLPIYGVRPEGVDETNEPTGCGGPSNALGTSPVLIGTKALRLTDHSASSRRIVFSASTKTAPTFQRVIVPAGGSVADPTLFGAQFTVYNAAGSGEKARVTLPASGWRKTTKGFQFTAAKPSPITKVVVANDKIEVSGGGAAWPYTLTAPQQEIVAVQLVLGSGTTWCTSALARSPTGDHPGSFAAASKSPAPASCPPAP